jgi:hypothetical protein
VGNTVEVGTTAGGKEEHVNRNVPSGNQYAQITLGTFQGAGGVEAGVILRSIGPATRTFYVFSAGRGNSLSSANMTCEIGKRVAGVFTSLVSSSGTTWVSGDRLKGTAQGNTLRLFRNEVQVLSVTDSALTSGKIGIRQSIQGAALITDNRISAFVGGSFPDTSTLGVG